MKSKSLWLLIAMFAIIVVFAGWTVYAQRSGSSTIQKTIWEYKVVYKHMSEQELNQLGAQGWELVQYDPGVRGGDASTLESFLFKRIK